MTDVTVQGFSRVNARLFAARILTEPQQVDQVMEIQCISVGDQQNAGHLLHASPMLLLFVCILANNDEIDLTQKKTPLGEIYFRLLRWVYKKYIIRQNKTFLASDFFNVLKKYGQLAMHMFSSDSNLLRESDIIKVVGPQPFQSGFLIGHRDSRLLKDETADVSVRFPHRSIQEFLIAFYFVITANDGWFQMCEDYPYLLNYPLMLQFCCWLLFCGHSYIPLAKRENVISVLEDMIAKCIDNIEIDIEELPSVYKSLDLRTVMATMMNPF